MVQHHTYFADDEWDWIEAKANERDDSISSVVREAVRRDMQSDVVEVEA